MGTSERKFKYRFLGPLGALVLGALLLALVLVGPMPVA
jgi:hypothetical protein